MSRRTIGTSFLLVVAAAASAAAAESAALTVRARDLQGAPLAGATATLHTRDGLVGRTAATGADGSHRFAELAAGEYLVSLTAHGFAAEGAQRLRLQPGDDASVAFQLGLAGLEESVVVTATATPQTADELSKAITIVGRDEIDVRDEHSIGDAVRRVPGVRVAQLGGAGALTSIRLRGMRSEDTSVLIDGVRFRDPSGTQGDASSFVSDLIVTGLDRIEVLRGSGSSLYGSHAIGGVVNLVTDGGGGVTRGGLLAEGGSSGLFRGRGTLAGSAGGDRLGYGLGLARLDSFRGVDGKGASHTTSGQGQLRLQLSPAAALTARFYGADTRADLTESPFAVGSASAGIVAAVPLARDQLRRYESGAPVDQLALGEASFVENAADPDYRRASRFASALLRFEQRPTARLGYALSYHGVWTARSVVDGPLGVSGFEPAGESRSGFDGRLHTLAARFDLSLGRSHLLTGGYELESEGFTNRELPADPAMRSLAEVTQRSHTAFTQLQLGLLEGALQLAGSVRAQSFRLEAPSFEPEQSSPYRGFAPSAPDDALTADGSVAYLLKGTGTKLRAHAGNGYRAPSPFERFGAFYGSFGYSVFGDPRLAPERSLGVDAGVDQDFGGGRLRASATWFRTRLDEVILFDFSGAIDPATDPFGRFGGYRNGEGVAARGLELSLAAAPAPGLSLNASYTWTDSEPREGAAGDADRAFLIPRHQLTLVATQRLGDFYANLDLALSDDYLAPIFDPVTFASRSYRFDGIAKLDLGFGYRIHLASGALRLFARLDDLLDRPYFENGFRTPGLTVQAGAAFEF